MVIVQNMKLEIENKFFWTFGMIEQSIILEIEKLLDNKKIVDSKLLSDSFGINCSPFFAINQFCN